MQRHWDRNYAEDKTGETAGTATTLRQSVTGPSPTAETKFYWYVSLLVWRQPAGAVIAGLKPAK